jgi:tetratricopeptide (TPR) repeat protein/uncharacterized protein YjdB
VTLTAVVFDAADRVITGRTITWTSRNAGVASVDGSGVVTGESLGSTEIVATVDGKSASAQVTVQKNAANKVEISTPTTTLNVGQQVDFTATVFDDANQQLDDRTVVWKSTPESVVQVVSTAGNSVTLRAVTSGAAVIEAQVQGEGNVRKEASVQVLQPPSTPAPVTRVEVAPKSATMSEGAKLRFTASTFGAGNQLLTGRSCTWASNSTTHATVNAATGEVTALRATRRARRSGRPAPHHRHVRGCLRKRRPRDQRLMGRRRPAPPLAVRALLLLVLSLGLGRVAAAQDLALKRSAARPRATACPTIAPPRQPGPEQRDEARQRATLAQEAAIVGNQRAAREQFARAAQLDPTSEDIAYQYGRTLEDAGSPTEALREYCRYLALAPAGSDAADVRGRVATMTPPSPVSNAADQATPQFNAGIASFDRGRYEEAVRAFSRAIGEAPTWADAHYNRALAHLALRTPGRAVADLRRYVELKPDAPDRVLVLNRIELIDRPVPFTPSGALGRGIVPGFGQFYTRRPVLGTAALAAAREASRSRCSRRTSGGPCAGRSSTSTASCGSTTTRSTCACTRTVWRGWPWPAA